MMDDTQWSKYYTPEMMAFDTVHRRYRLLSDVPRNTARTFGNRTAYSCILENGLRANLSFETLDEASSALAIYFQEVLKLENGQVVALMSPNTLAFPIVFYGIQKAGLIATHINPLSTAPETNAILKASGARAIVATDLFAETIENSLTGTAVGSLIWLNLVDFFLPPIRWYVHYQLRRKGKIPRHKPKGISLLAAIHRGRSIADHHMIDDITYTIGQLTSDTAVIQFTAGTSGQPKGVELTHSNLMSNAEMMLAAAASAIKSGEETILMALPMDHTFGLVIGILSFHLNGDHIILIPNPRPIGNLRPAFEHYDITWLPGVNTLFAALNEEGWFQENPPKSLKVAVSAVTKLSTVVADRFEYLTGCKLHEGYGLTEAGPAVSLCPPHLSTHRGSVGIPLPGVEVKVIQQNGESIPNGDVGELCVRSPSVMKGYLNDPEGTKQAMVAGWLRTGDMAIINENNFITIVERKNSTIMVSGFLVMPSEVAEVIQQMHGIREVGVIGVPDPKSGDVPAAFAVRCDQSVTTESVLAFCAERLTAYKCPKHIVFVEALPRNAVGKISHQGLRDLAQQESWSS